MTASGEFNLPGCPLDGISLIEASAGTGKTWNICGLYLRLLLERKMSVQQILVVTFTNAATAELRERIRTRIAEALHYATGRAAGDTADPFITALTATLSQTGDATREQLAERLDLALQTFDEASIFTIHGFCQRALADTAFAAGLPFEVELMTDDSEIMMEAVNDFWRRRIAGDGLPPALASYLVDRRDTPESFARLVARHLAKPLARCVWPGALDRSEAIDTAALVSAYNTARATWSADKAEITAYLTQSLPALHGGTYKPASIDEATAAWESYFQASAPLAKLGKKVDLLCSSRLFKSTKKNRVTPAHSFCDRAEALLSLHAAAHEELELARLRIVRSLLDDVGPDLIRRKRERRVIAFNDMLSNLHTALHNENYPWLAASLRERFPAALIDEFQDTDPLQFAIFDAVYGSAARDHSAVPSVPSVTNASATAQGAFDFSDQPEVPRSGEASLFLVGDPKQAIYSFRNADLYTYLAARRRAGAAYTLAENQRSTPGLIAAVNALFETNARAFMLPGLDYRAVTEGQRKREPFRDASLPRPDLQVWMLPDPPIDRAMVRQQAVQATAAEIARLLSEAAAGLIEISERPLRPKDIAILVRSHAQGSELKRMLATLNIGSVELSQESVFATVDAEEVERVLTAIIEPTRTALLRSALATEMIGCDAADIAALSGDEVRLLARIERFALYRETWLRMGVGVMFRQILTDEGASARLLCRADGERRLTNLLHLGEELHKAAEVHDSPDAMLRWLQTQRREASIEEAAQLRLESDQNLVQIATIHKAKGLEFPIVFCPFLWDGFMLGRNSGLDGLEYHDHSGAAVIDFRTGPEFEPFEAGIKAQIKLEDSAELLRLAYVALTRAVYRCYLIAGSYSRNNFGKSSVSESSRSLLNWLVAGNGQAPDAWFAGKPTPEAIAAAWQALAQKQPHVGLTPLPDTPGTPIALSQPAADTLTALTPPTQIANAWRISSFSGLANGAVNESAASDHDARNAGVGKVIGLPPADIAPDDILRFPRGTNAGDCLHAVLERIDFTQPSTWSDGIARGLGAHPQALPDSGTANARRPLAAMIARMLADVMNTTLPSGATLGAIPLHKRLTELEFSMSSGEVSANQLNRLLAQLGYAVPRLTFGSLEGYLKGFIDLVFEDGGRYYILDWKSNHLGYAAADYSRESMESAMVEHGYHLQYLIYSLALDRYLAHRMAHYSFDDHFGGVLYLFIRGVRPRWTNPDGMATGVYHHRPAATTLGALDRLLCGRERRRPA
ncbi:MAG: exodeoxyribonuclease V subunit beta [Betaproteobacteria bacterium]